MNPAPPVTRILTRPLPGLGADLHLAMVPENQAVRLADPGRRCHLDVVTDQRRFDPADTTDGGSPEHDRVLDLAVGDNAARRHRGERADVGAGHDGPSPD